MAGVAGVEPTSAVLETVILPLNYTPKNQLLSKYITINIYFQDFTKKKMHLLHLLHSSSWIGMHDDEPVMRVKPV